MAKHGTDIMHVVDTDRDDYAEQLLSWSADGHIYWSEYGPYIHKVNVETGEREVAHTAVNGDIRLARVSQDGERAGCTREDSGYWTAWAIDLSTHEERLIGEGCQATSSPDGTLLSHNIPGHQTANVHLCADLSVYRTIHKPEGRGEFVVHFFPTGSNSHLVYTSDVDFAYVHDIETDTPTSLGRGAPFDYRPKDAGPKVQLGKASISFDGDSDATTDSDDTSAGGAAGGCSCEVLTGSKAALLELLLGTL